MIVADSFIEVDLDILTDEVDLDKPVMCEIRFFDEDPCENVATWVATAGCCGAQRLVCDEDKAAYDHTERIIHCQGERPVHIIWRRL